MTHDHLGEFEHLVLLAVLQTMPEAYGVPIRREIVERTGRDTSFGAVYATVRRLERKGLVESELDDEEGRDGPGRPRKMVRITPEGLDALQAARGRLSRMAEGLEELLGGDL